MPLRESLITRAEEYLMPNLRVALWVLAPERPESVQVDIIRRVQELAETHPSTQDDLARDSKVELAYNTEVYWCHKSL